LPSLGDGLVEIATTVANAMVIKEATTDRSEVVVEDCAEEGLGYADFVGNARLSFDRIFIETRVAGNSLSVKREAKSVFSPNATRVQRVLLQGPLRAWKVKYLAAAADVSLAHVSAVRRRFWLRNVQRR
jgi:hypothetical protein